MRGNRDKWNPQLNRARTTRNRLLARMGEGSKKVRKEASFLITNISHRVQLSNPRNRASSLVEEQERGQGIQR
jgi:hypothetical protein